MAKGITRFYTWACVISFYINDMSGAVKCKLLRYAVDSVLLASGTDLVGIEATLSSKRESVNGWLINNKLSLHFDKTQPIMQM